MDNEVLKMNDLHRSFLKAIKLCINLGGTTQDILDLIAEIENEDLPKGRPKTKKKRQKAIKKVTDRESVT